MATRAYLRAGTAPGGPTIPTQRKHVGELAVRRGLGPVTWYVDRRCGGGRTLETRQAGARLLAELRRGDVVVIASLDRLAVDLADLSRLLEAFRAIGTALHTPLMLGDICGDRGLAVLLDALERFQERRAAETRAEPRPVSRAGKAPYGHCLGPEGELDIDPAEQEMIAEAIAHRETGLSYGRIGVIVGAEYRNGAPLHREQVRRLVERHRIELPERVDRIALQTMIARQAKAGLSWPDIAATVSEAFGIALDAGAVYRLSLADPARSGGWTERVTA